MPYEIDWAATGSMMSGIGALLTAAIAFLGAAFAWRQVRAFLRLNAEDAYFLFHRLSFDNPEFAEPNLESIKSNDTSYFKYKWFVVYMLMAIERVIIILPKDETWRNAVTDDLFVHSDFICSDDFSKYIPNFSYKMQAFLKAFIASRVKKETR